MKDDEYVLWDAADLPNVCSLSKMAGLDKTYRLVDGVPMQSEFPDGVHFQMDPDNPTDTLLADNLINPYSVIVASDALATFIRDGHGKKLEFLPVSIVDHRGKTVPESYFIIHPVDHVDCLDVDASGGQWDLIDSEVLDSVERIVLDQEKLDPGRSIFRPCPLVDVVVIRRALAEELQQSGFSGLEWVELSDYPGI